MSVHTFFSANLLLAYTAYFIGTASPGPSNLAIMSIAATQCRKAALVFALGVISGSIFWATVAALGVSAALLAWSKLLVAIKVFGGYALVFSMDGARRLYVRGRRAMEACLAVVFGVAGARLLVTNV
ncbi:LysE family transporter [Burkholderia sp. BCC0044]|uniref:LysE family transporter n=1 Tax=Burkholderia sp. BCC0044 TaxID=2676295 RepID=UPI001589EA76|nr:LysE family transporter [Burkholderia sp. BCC0044]